MVQGKSVRVLLVEDSPPDARLLALALSEVSHPRFELVTVARLSEAIEAAREHEFDVALLDLSLPDSSGLQTFRAFHEALPSLPVVVLTGLEDDAVALRAAQAGAQDYLQKSGLSGHAVARTLRYAIERQRLTIELKEHASRLADSEASFRIIANNADGLMVLDDDNVVQFANPATARILERPVDSIVGRRFEYRLQAGLQDVEVMTPVGLRSIEARVQELEWEGGAKRLASLRDITEKRNLEVQLMHAQKMEVLGRLAGGVAHDFNNILTAISGHAELAGLCAPEGSEVLEHAEEIGVSVERAKGLIRQLLAFSRKEDATVDAVDLSDSINDALGMLSRILGADIAINVRADAALAPILGDRLQIEQVLMNLAVNAADAMKGSGTLELETRMVKVEGALARRLPNASPGVYVELAVRDDGAGMTEETVSRIFEPFFTTKEAGKGTGLGLSMVFSIVRRWDGYILVDSAPGMGTSFRILFPPGHGAPTEVAAIPAHPSDAPTGHERLLVVDDDRSIRELLARVFIDAGYRVNVASDGQQAIDQCDALEGSIDLLISDLAMPGVGGRALYRELSARYPDMKAMFISGQAGDEDSDIVLLQKPFTLGELARRARAVLDGD